MKFALALCTAVLLGLLPSQTIAVDIQEDSTLSNFANKLAAFHIKLDEEIESLANPITRRIMDELLSQLEDFNKAAQDLKNLKSELFTYRAPRNTNDELQLQTRLQTWAGEQLSRVQAANNSDAQIVQIAEEIVSTLVDRHNALISKCAQELEQQFSQFEGEQRDAAYREATLLDSLIDAALACLPPPGTELSLDESIQCAKNVRQHYENLNYVRLAFVNRVHVAVRFLAESVGRTPCAVETLKQFEQQKLEVARDVSTLIDFANAQ